MTQFYIGTKLIEAWEKEKDGKAGYAVKYSDGYTSWSPKDVFKKAYLPMGLLPKTSDNSTKPEVLNTNKITEKMVEDFIDSSKIVVQKMSPKTTTVLVELPNGYIIVEASSCVDPANYDLELGTKICKKRIQEKVWMLLGFLLQTAINGVQPEYKKDEAPTVQ